MLVYLTFIVAAYCATRMVEIVVEHAKVKQGTFGDAALILLGLPIAAMILYWAYQVNQIASSVPTSLYDIPR